MYIKIFGSDLISRIGDIKNHARDAISVSNTTWPQPVPVPKAGLITDPGSSTYSGGSSVSGDRVNDDNDFKPPRTHTSTQFRMEPMTIDKAPAYMASETTNTATLLTSAVATPSPVPDVIDPLSDDESPTTTSTLDTLPSPSQNPPADSTPSSVTDTSWMTTSSSLPIPTSTFPVPILATPIVQGPTPNPGNNTANAAASQSSSQSGSSRPLLSGGATAAISVVAIMTTLALGLWLYRQWSIRKRKKRQSDWWVPEPFLIQANSTTASPPMQQKPSQVSRSIPRVRPPSLPLPAIPAYLPGPESGDGAVQTYSPPRSARVANIGVVRCVFEPRMTDELRVRVGDAVRVLAEYDDGWGFCENVRMERGMVPLECLEGENITSIGKPGTAAGLLGLGQPSFARSNTRTSSLPAKRA